MLWWWALDYAQDGDLSKFQSDEIEIGAEWDGETGKFVEALSVAGYLDDDAQLHDWIDYAGKFIEQRENGKSTNLQRQEEAESRIRNAVVKIQASGQVVSLNAVVAEARCSKSTAKRVLQSLEIGTSGTVHAGTGGMVRYMPTLPNQQYQPTNSTNHVHAQEEPLPPPSQNESSLDAYCQEIELTMVECGANENYAAKGQAFEWVKKFHASQVPIDFIRRSIVQAYAKNPRISTFTYCAKVIQDDWARELAKQTPAEPLHFEISATSVNPRAAPVDNEFLAKYAIDEQVT
jgi:hypothetical protein